MLQKLRKAELRFCELEKMLSDTSIVENQDEYKKVMKEYKLLSPIIEKFQEYNKAETELSEADAIMRDSGVESELRELAEEEVKRLKTETDSLLEQLKILLLPRDPNDDKNVIVEIRAGAGGEEAALFAYVLYRM